MKTKIFQNPMVRMAALAICTATLTAVPVLVAQETSTPPPATAPQDNAAPPMGHRGMGERHIQMLTKRLNLSPDQVSQIKAIDADTMTQMKALRQDTTTSRADKRSKMMEIHQASQDKIRNVLNDEQKTKFDAMQAKMQARRQGRHGGAGAPPPPPPQQ